MNESRRWSWIPAAGLPLSLPLSVLAVAAACQTPTSVTLTVSTDADCAGQSQSRQAHVVTGAPDDVIGRLTASSTKECAKSGDVGDLVLLPKDDENAPLGIKVILGVDKPTEDCGKNGATELEKWAGCIIARRRLGFIEGEALIVDVPLHDECKGIPCSEEGFETCVAGGRCVSADIDPDDCLDGPCKEDELPPVASTGVGPSVSSASISSSAAGGAGGEGGEGGGPTTDAAISASSAGGLGGAGGEGGEGGEGGGAGSGGGGAGSGGGPICPCPDDACTNGCGPDGQCLVEPTSTPCDQVCTDASLVVSYCNGAGFCPGVVEEVSCGSLQCADADSCLTECDSLDDCVEPLICDGTECVPADGCRNASTDCPAAPTCQNAICDGNRCATEPAASDVACQDECDGNTAVERACNSGGCVTFAKNCCAHACDPDTLMCFASCTTDAQCFGGASCNNQGVCAGGPMNLIPTPGCVGGLD